MPIFNDTLLTTRGFEAANKAANGQGSFTIIKAVASQRDYRDKNENELRQLTSLENEIEGQILDQDNSDKMVTGIKTNYNNEVARNGYTANAVGLYARDNNGNEFLYGVTTAQIGQVVPPIENDKLFSGFELTIYVVVGNVDNMKVELTPGGVATINYVNKTVAKAKEDNFDYHGMWNGSLAELRHAKDGIYQIDPSNTDAKVIEGFSGYGVAIVYHNGTDCYVDVKDNTNRVWHNNTVNDTFQGWREVPSMKDVSNLQSYASGIASNLSNTQNQLNEFTINNTYKGNGDMQGMASGIWRLNNNQMKNGPYADGTAYTGTVINYGWYTTYVDHGGDTFVTSPDSNGWQRYATDKSVAKGFEYHGLWNGSLAELRNAKDGIYQIDPSNTDAKVIEGFSGYGVAIVYHNGTDCYVDVKDNTNRVWHNNTVNDTFQDWREIPSMMDIKNVQNRLNEFTINNTYTGNDDMQGMNTGIWRLNNTEMNNGPYPNGTAYTGTVINYGWYTTYVDWTGDTFVTSPNSSGWKKYANNSDLDKKVTDNQDGTITFNGYTQAMFKSFDKAVDYNDLASPGRFVCPINATGTYAHSPLNVTGVRGTVILDVVNNNAGDIYQTAYVPSVNTTLYRQYSFGQWTNWIQFATSEQITNLQTQINATNSNSFTLNGHWTDSFNNLNNAKDGYWHVGGNYSGTPTNWTGYGIVLVMHNYGDCFVRAWDNNNNEWRNHYGNNTWNGWRAV